jgi:hypothetical protein
LSPSSSGESNRPSDLQVAPGVGVWLALSYIADTTNSGCPNVDDCGVTTKACAIGIVLALAACSSGHGDESAPSRPQLASGKGLPARCVLRRVRPAATVTFVANRRAWALEPRGGRLTCLFSVPNAGPFAWGPRGDRALLARLEVKALADAPTRAPSRVDPPASSWGRPIGKSIVFVGRGGSALLKAHPGTRGFTDVTPLPDVRYERVAYHPSGLAFAFVLRRGTHESVWISSNVGDRPRRLVHGRLHTAFGAIAFGKRGTTLYFAARHKDGRVDVHALPLVGANFAPVVWRGGPDERVTDLFPGRRDDLAFTVGGSCESRHAVFVTGTQSEGTDLLPEHRPSRALGWLDDRHVLVATGGCGQKLDLYSVSTASTDARLLVQGVDAASVRRAERLPPPPLPRRILRERSSFA